MTHFILVTTTRDVKFKVKLLINTNIIRKVKEFANGCVIETHYDTHFVKEPIDNIHKQLSFNNSEYSHM